MIDCLRSETYMVRHNPNCPKAFEVRLTGAGIACNFWPRLIRAPADDVGYGDTAEEAGINALAARAARLWAIHHGVGVRVKAKYAGK